MNFNLRDSYATVGITWRCLKIVGLNFLIILIRVEGGYILRVELMRLWFASWILWFEGYRVTWRFSRLLSCHFICSSSLFLFLASVTQPIIHPPTTRDCQAEGRRAAVWLPAPSSAATWPAWPCCSAPWLPSSCSGSSRLPSCPSSSSPK